MLTLAIDYEINFEMAKYQYHLICHYFNSGSLALDEQNDAAFYDELFQEPVYTGLLRFQLRTAKD